MAKKITVNILNLQNDINLENKEIEVKTGIAINGIEELVPFGNFIIEKPENQEVKKKTSFTGYDYMIKFNVLYKNRIAFPVRTSELFKDVCNQVGLEAGNIEFINSNYVILGNPFNNNEDCRTVLSNIAQLAGGFARIGRDNRVYIKTLKNISNLLTVKYINAMTVKELNLTLVKALASEKNNADENIDGNNYFDDFLKNEQWGELNSLVLSVSNIEGENIALDDKESIKENGLTEITIQDNYFLINQEEREKAIVPIWNCLKGIKYLPFKTKYYGYPYLDTGDMIYIKDINDKGYISYVFNHTFTFNGTFSGTLETPALTKTQTAYKNTFDMKTRFRTAERNINKIDGKIQDLISRVEDITNTVEGTKAISLGNCVEGNLLELHVYGNNTVFDYLYPNDDLYPSDTLYPKGDSRIVVTDKDGKQSIYELGIKDVLRQNEEVYDEYILKDGQASIIRRVNADGTTKAEEAVEDLGNYWIDLANGTNVITIENYNARLKAKFAIKNSYTDIYATKVEMNAKFEMESENINLELNKKVDEKQIIASINMSTEKAEDGSQLKLKADKIGLEGNVTANGNFKIDEEGNMECKKATCEDISIINGKINMFIDDTAEVEEFALKDKNINSILIFTGHGLYINGYYDGTWTRRIVDIGIDTTTGHGFIDVIGNVYADNISSDERLKENIKDSEIKATDVLKKIKIRSFDWIRDKKHVNAGIIAQEVEKIDENFVLKKPILNKDKQIEDYQYYINELPIMNTLIKGFQEQQKTIEKLSREIEKLKGGTINGQF